MSHRPAAAAAALAAFFLLSLDARGQAPPLPDDDDEVPAAPGKAPRPAAPAPPAAPRLAPPVGPFAAPPPPPAFAVPPPPPTFAVPPPRLRVLVPPPPARPWWQRRFHPPKRKRPDDVGRVYINARFARLWSKDSGGYLDRAKGLGLGRSLGGLFEVGIEVLPRFQVVASYGYQHAGGNNQSPELGLTSDALLAHLRYAVWRRYSASGKSMGQLQASAGTGVWRIDETGLGHLRRSSSGGFRGGVDLSAYYGVMGIVFGYGWTYAPARIFDGQGGKVEAGGHEANIGLSLRL